MAILAMLRRGQDARGTSPERHTSPLRLSAVSLPRMSGRAGRIPLANHAACHGHLGHAPARAGCPWHVPGVTHFPASVIGGFDAEDERQSEPNRARSHAACHGHLGHAPARAGCPLPVPRAAHFPTSVIGGIDAEDERYASEPTGPRPG
jgi:hypothetical protein